MFYYDKGILVKQIRNAFIKISLKHITNKSPWIPYSHSSPLSHISQLFSIKGFFVVYFFLYFPLLPSTSSKKDPPHVLSLAILLITVAISFMICQMAKSLCVTMFNFTNIIFPFLLSIHLHPLPITS